MFNFFKKKTERERLQIKQQKLLSDAYKLSHTNRTLSDQKIVEAEAISNKIESIGNTSV